MDVTPATQPTNALAPSAGSGSGSLISSDFETFLRMLTTQMQNQDPLEPMKSDELSVQLATFSGVEQQVRSNELLTQLGLQLGALGMSQLASWVGMEARAPVPGYFDGDPVTISPNPAAIADQAILVVRDEAGVEMARLPIPVSSDPYDWDGADASGTILPEGLYHFSVESYSDGELLGTNGAEAYSRIIEARGENGDTILVLEGGVSVTSSGITALRGG